MCLSCIFFVPTVIFRGDKWDDIGKKTTTPEPAVIAALNAVQLRHSVARLIHFKAMVIILHFTWKCSAFLFSELSVGMDGMMLYLSISLCLTFLYHEINWDVAFSSVPRESLNYEKNAN